jgi:hypothetical protein
MDLPEDDRDMNDLISRASCGYFGLKGNVTIEGRSYDSHHFHIIAKQRHVVIGLHHRVFGRIWISGIEMA